MIRILIADDHSVVRAGLRALFAGESGIHVIAEAGTSEDAVKLRAEGGIDLVPRGRACSRKRFIR